MARGGTRAERRVQCVSQFPSWLASQQQNVKTLKYLSFKAFLASLFGS